MPVISKYPVLSKYQFCNLCFTIEQNRLRNNISGISGQQSKDTCLSATSEQYIKRVLGNMKYLSMYSQWVG